MAGGSVDQGEFLAVGRIIKPHGIRGVLVVEPFEEGLSFLPSAEAIYLGPRKQERSIRGCQWHRRRFLLTLEGCEDRNTAESLRGVELYLPKADLVTRPAGVFQPWEIRGLRVLTDQGEDLGNIAQILETGANDVYVVRDAQGREILLPAIESVVLSVDLAAGQILVHLLPGLRAP